MKLYLSLFLTLLSFSCSQAFGDCHEKALPLPTPTREEKMEFIKKLNEDVDSSWGCSGKYYLGSELEYTKCARKY